MDEMMSVSVRSRETDLLQFMMALCETNSSNYAQNIRIMNILNWANLCARCVSHHLLTSDWLYSECYL